MAGSVPRVGTCKRQLVSLLHWCFSPSLSPSLPCSPKINTVFYKNAFFLGLLWHLPPLWSGHFKKKNLLLFNYSCMPFLPIPPPHYQATFKPKLTAESPLPWRLQGSGEAHTTRWLGSGLLVMTTRRASLIPQESESWALLPSQAGYSHALWVLLYNHAICLFFFFILEYS